MFKKLDIIGKQIGFEIDGDTTFKTNWGAFISGCLIIATIVMSFFFGKEVYERKNPLGTSTFVKETVSISAKEFIIMFSLRVAGKPGIA